MSEATEGETQVVEPAEGAIRALDPSAPDIDRQIERLASDQRVNVWVLGPLEFDAVPLRVPRGATRAGAVALGNATWPQAALTDATEIYPVPETLSGTTGLPAGSAGIMYVTGINNTDFGANTTYESDEVPPQTVAWLAVFDRVPQGSSSSWAGSWRAWQRLVSGWFPFVIGGLLALLA